MSERLFAKLSLIIHGRLVCESSSPILALCLCDHTRVNKPETKLHRLTLSPSPIFMKKSSHDQGSYLLLHFSNDIGNYYHSH
ncbi:hypothetical protein CCV75_20305 [Salmonella enterica subsp. enterica serovar Enteritidis]|nr:hypothetical protein [Salmonella enterica subsp. enterica serovar Enteritidis]